MGGWFLFYWHYRILISTMIPWEWNPLEHAEILCALRLCYSLICHLRVDNHTFKEHLRAMKIPQIYQNIQYWLFRIRWETKRNKKQALKQRTRLLRGNVPKYSKNLISTSMSRSKPSSACKKVMANWPNLGSWKCPKNPEIRAQGLTPFFRVVCRSATAMPTSPPPPSGWQMPRIKHPCCVSAQLSWWSSAYGDTGYIWILDWCWEEKLKRVNSVFIPQSEGFQNTLQCSAISQPTANINIQHLDSCLSKCENSHINQGLSCPKASKDFRNAAGQPTRPI